MKEDGTATYPEALELVLAGAQPLEVESVGIESALNRALATDVVSEIALPPWDNSGMDGYAVRKEDVVGARPYQPVSLVIVGESAAGAITSELPAILSGQAVRIMTGAPVPAGANAVVRVEDTAETRDGEARNVVIISDRDAHGRSNVRPRGEEIKSGDTVFTRGTTIFPAHLGAMASIGCKVVDVHRRPKVAIVSGGDELVLLDAFDAVRAGRRIISSTSYSLPPLLESFGADVRVLPLAKDTLKAVTDSLSSAIDGDCDLLITTGGISVGAHDYTRDALLSLGGNIEFWRARIRPGGPVGTGRVRGVKWLGLPGNSVSSMVTALLFAAPLIRLLAGHRSIYNSTVRVRMTEGVDTPGSLAHFLRVILTAADDGVHEARLAGAQGSNLLRNLALANALLCVPEEVMKTAPGDIYDAILLPASLTCSSPLSTNVNQ